MPAPAIRSLLSALAVLAGLCTSHAHAATIVQTQTVPFSVTFSDFRDISNEHGSTYSATPVEFASPDNAIGRLTSAYFEFDSRMDFSYAFLGTFNNVEFTRVFRPYLRQGNVGFDLPVVSLPFSCGGSFTGCVDGKSLSQPYDLAVQLSVDLAHPSFRPDAESLFQAANPGIMESVARGVISHTESFSWKGDLSLVYLYDTEAVPEPATWAMLLIGVGMLGVVMRRRRRLGALA